MRDMINPSKYKYYLDFSWDESQLCQLYKLYYSNVAHTRRCHHSVLAMKRAAGKNYV